MSREFLPRKKYYQKLKDKCEKCGEYHLMEVYCKKSDWHEFRQCPSCNHRLISLGHKDLPLDKYEKPKTKRGEDYYVYL